MNISLTPQLESLLKEKVATGMYNSVSEVVREALRLMSEQDKLNEIKLNNLREEISLGISSLDQGKGSVMDIEQIKANGRKTLVEGTSNGSTGNLSRS